MAKRKTKQWKENVGNGVKKFNEETIKKLCDAFAIDLNVLEACNYAEITSACYYENVKKNPKLLDRFDLFKSKLSIKAKHNIAQTIHAGDVPLSERYLARKQPSEYADTLKIEHSEGIGIGTPQEDKDVITELHKKLTENRLNRSREKAIADGEIKE